MTMKDVGLSMRFKPLARAERNEECRPVFGTAKVSTCKENRQSKRERVICGPRVFFFFTCLTWDLPCASVHAWPHDASRVAGAIMTRHHRESIGELLSSSKGSWLIPYVEQKRFLLLRRGR